MHAKCNLVFSYNGQCHLLTVYFAQPTSNGPWVHSVAESGWKSLLSVCHVVITQ
jgi:hypothetical protein